MKLEIVCMLLIAILLALVGCQAPQPGYYEQLTQTVNNGADKILEALEGSDKIPPDKMADLNEKIETLQTTALESAKAYDQSDDQIGGWLKVGEIVAGVFSPEIALLIGAAGVGLAKYKSGKLEVSDKKYKSMKQGANKFINANGSAGKELYAEIGKARKANGVT